jgi:hypothetical protein
VLPGTPVDHVRALVDAVHELSRDGRGGPDRPAEVPRRDGRAGGTPA